MATLETLWEILRGVGLEELAPVLLKHGARSAADIHLRSGELLGSGIKQWQLATLLAGPQKADPAPRVNRADLCHCLSVEEGRH